MKHKLIELLNQLTEAQTLLCKMISEAGEQLADDSPPSENQSDSFEDELFEDELFEDELFENPRWKNLDATQRKELMDNVFNDADWYNGLPHYRGGDYNPDFFEIAKRCGAETNDIKKYYVAWLRKGGIDPRNALSCGKL